MVPKQVSAQQLGACLGRGRRHTPWPQWLLVKTASNQSTAQRAKQPDQAAHECACFVLQSSPVNQPVQRSQAWLTGLLCVRHAHSLVDRTPVLAARSLIIMIDTPCARLPISSECSEQGLLSCPSWHGTGLAWQWGGSLGMFVAWLLHFFGLVWVAFVHSQDEWLPG